VAVEEGEAPLEEVEGQHDVVEATTLDLALVVKHRIVG
jgi:hypothetical protein